MITDRHRFDAYVNALRAAIRPDTSVLEIGTGIGLFAVLARQFGARRVVALEPSDAVTVARLIAKDNRVPDIEFIQALSTDLNLSERFDVIVSDLRGVLPQMKGHIETIVDARERLLAPGGTIIPAVDTLYAAPVELPEFYAQWTASNAADRGVRLQAIQRFTTNWWTRVRVKPDQLLAPAASWATLDYRHAITLDACGMSRWHAQRGGVVHGVAVWFEGQLFGDVVLSNAPTAPELVYGNAFFPWSEPVSVAAGDEITVRFDVRRVGDDYVWRWVSEVRATDGHVKARFDQSTYFALPIVPGRLAHGDADNVVALNEDGQVERLIVDAMDGRTPNEEIAHRLTERFPRRFARLNDALGQVASVAQRFASESVRTPVG